MDNRCLSKKSKVRTDKNRPNPKGTNFGQDQPDHFEFNGRMGKQTAVLTTIGPTKTGAIF
jgi:hypothetical protein